MRHIAAFAFLGMVLAVHVPACGPVFGSYRQGECGDDEDLKELGNLHVGAICVDGHAECPDGRPFCYAFHDYPVQDQLVPTCVGPCVECPDNKGACIYTTPEKGLRYQCMSSASDCWEGVFYWLDLDSLTKGCPTMSPDCR